jgi:biotin carboxyl carrier protein
MIQQALPVVQAAPEIMPVIGAMMKFAAQGFRVGREMEGEIDKAMQAIQQRMSQPQQPPQPDPTEQLKSEATQATAKAAIVRANADIAKTQMEMSAPMAGSVAA